MRNRSGGAILVMTLWVVALLSLLAFATVTRARLSIRTASSDVTELRCGELLSTLAQLSLARLSYDDNPALDSFQESWGRSFEADGAAALSGFSDVAPEDEDLSLAVVAVDECGKINVNEAPRALLVQVLRETSASGIAEEIASAIVDWRDPDDLGAYERDAYADRTPSCAPSNKPFAHIEELLFVQGVTPDLFFGEDGNRNGLLDPEEDDGALFLPPDNGDGQLQPGLTDLLTVEGEGAVNANTCCESVLRAVLSLAAPSSNPDDLAQAVLGRRRGPDALDGTDDDRPFENPEALAKALGPEAHRACLDAGIEFDVVSSAFRFYLHAAVPSKHIAREADLLVLREGQDLRVAEWHDGQ